MGLLLRTIIVIPLIVGMVLIGTVGFQVLEPIYEMSQNEGMDGAEKGFGTDQEKATSDTIMLFAAVGLISFVLILSVWWIIGDLTSDVQQRQARIR